MCVAEGDRYYLVYCLSDNLRFRSGPVLFSLLFEQQFALQKGVGIT